MSFTDLIGSRQVANLYKKPEVEPAKVKPEAVEKKPTETVGQTFASSTQRLASEVLKLKLNNLVSAPAYAAPQPAAEPIDQEKIDFLKDFLRDAGHLGIALGSPEFNPDSQPNQAERIKLIGEIVRGEDAAAMLLDYGTDVSGSGVRNSTYDNQRIVAEAVGEAYRAGEINDTDLRNLLEQIGEERAPELILTLNSDPANAQSGGVIESLGRQAESLGYEQAAALAFTSSEALITTNLPDAASREAAFEQVRSFIDNSPLRDNPELGTTFGGEALRAEFTFAVANAARLTARGDGYSQTDFENLLSDLGPTLASEIVSRSASVSGDNLSNGALELLGRTSRDIAADAEGDDKTKWEVNQYAAFTQSPALINRNLTTPTERMKAFDVLNQELVNSRDDVNLALEYNFSLLRQPAATRGLTTLLENNGTEILDAKLGTSGTNYAGQADLVQFLQSTLYSPITDPAVADRIKNVMGDYIDDTFANAQNGDVRGGERIGALMGLHDVAFQRAFEAASTPEQQSKMEEIQNAVVKTVLSKAAGALLAPTGPVGSAVGDFVMGQVLDEIFKDRTPSPQELGAEFLNLLEERGIDINDASNYRDNLIEVIKVIREGLEAQLDSGDLTQAQTDDIQNTLNTLTTIESNFRDRSLETQNEYDNPNGQIRSELED